MFSGCEGGIWLLRDVLNCRTPKLQRAFSLEPIFRRGDLICRAMEPRASSGGEVKYLLPVTPCHRFVPHEPRRGIYPGRPTTLLSIAY